MMRTLIDKYSALWVKSERAKLLAPTEEEKRAIEDRKRPTSRPPTSRTGAWRTPKPLSTPSRGVGGMQPWSARRRRRAASAALGQRRARHPRALASRGANSSSSMLWRWPHCVTVLVIGWWVWWVWWVNSSHQHAGSILPRSDEHPPRIPPSPPFPLLHAAY